MPGLKSSRYLFALTALCAVGVASCGGRERPKAAAAKVENEGPEQEKAPKVDPAAQLEAQKQAELDHAFPLHGVVTGLQIRVRQKPDPDATTLGWLRSGSRIRLAKDPQKARNCATGFYAVAPRGYACAGEGIEVADKPPKSILATTQAAKDAALPYAYYFVKDFMVPEFHRLPTREDQRQAREYGTRYLELKDKNEKLAARLKAGELANEPKSPAFVKRYLDRGFFVAGAGIEERKSRKFVRTVRGSYIQLAQLETRTGPSFKGIALDEETGQELPLAWAVRDARPFVIKYRDDGSQRLIANEEEEPIERHTLVPWEKFERVDNKLYHRLKDGRYLKFWFLAVAQKRPRPKGVGADEPWVHINLEQQTLVAYSGDTPVYATLVSSGLPEHETPSGLFEIRTKQVSATMSDIGPEVGDDERYSIEDVPWTQYFSGSVALHGAFWHERFGLQRSHGCVNLSPRDAHEIFNITWPDVPDGWHGATTENTGFRSSKVWITEK